METWSADQDLHLSIFPSSRDATTQPQTHPFPYFEVTPPSSKYVFPVSTDFVWKQIHPNPVSNSSPY